jgi:hypothetical protein
VNVLKDIVASVSPTIPSRMSGYVDPYESDDDEEQMDKIKSAIKTKSIGLFNILCIWDCAHIWIRTSEILAYLVFDPFTELFITLCIIVNVVFMALDHYTIEFDSNGGM